MKNLLKIIFGSCLGTIIALFALILIFGGIATVVGKQFEKKTPNIKSNSVLSIKLDNVVPERTNNVEVLNFSQLDKDTYGIHDLVAAIKHAKDDKKIKGIYLSIETAGLGFVKAEELRNALIDFKESGKFVYAYADYMGNTAYYLASVADEIALHPIGILDLRGFGSVIPYFTEFLEKIGVEMEVYYAGKFKSATEPFRRNDMSPENRQQLHSVLDEVYKLYVNEVATSRGLSVTELKSSIDSYDGSSPQLALQAGLIDLVGYQDEILAKMKDDLDFEEDEELNVVNLNTYASTVKNSKDFSVKEKIAVVYAEGEIMGEEEANGRITSEAYVNALRSIRVDDNIKAVVLRVDSGGGSALISDKIWREFERIRKDGKPVVVSFGNYAASGGYYIASSSDSIFSDEKTITGSIGVFSMLPNTENLMEEKLKIYQDTVHTGKFATKFRLSESRTEEERVVLQRNVDHIYNEFLTRVANNRNMTIEEVNEIAQGRIWTGSQAVEIGLVDKIGGLQDAINSAAKLANLEDYRLTDYPRIKSPYERLISEITGQDIKMTDKIFEEIKSEIPMIGQLVDIKTYEKPQARLTYNITFD